VNCTPVVLHGWKWGLTWYFLGIVCGCVLILLWDAYRVNKALWILREDIRRDNPPAFKGGNHD
jgi:hypothetical protein